MESGATLGVLYRTMAGRGGECEVGKLRGREVERGRS